MQINDHSDRLMLWRFRFSDYDFEVRYEKGTLNQFENFESLMYMENSNLVDEDHDEIPCFFMYCSSDIESEIVDVAFLLISKSPLYSRSYDSCNLRRDLDRATVR